MRVKKGLCKCGCGAKTRIARSNEKISWVKGQPVRFIRGHNLKSTLSLVERKLLKCKITKEWFVRHPLYHKQRYEKYPWRRVVSTAIYRAKKAGLPCDISQKWAKKVWTGKCAISDIPFILGFSKENRNPYSPSIDRVIPSLGYTKVNTRFILWAFNAFKGTDTDVEMFKLSKRLLIHNGYQVKKC